PDSPVDVSIEVMHVYRTESAPAALARHAEREARWVEAIAASLDRHQRSWSVCMLVDDTDPRSDGDELEGRLRDAWLATGLPLDHLVRETECAASIGRMVDRFTGEVDLGLAGALGTAVRLPPVDVLAERARWLANGEPGRPSTTRLSAAELNEEPGEARIVPVRVTGSRAHGIPLDVELWSTAAHGEQVWSCPMLAAWWQLLRLGAPHLDRVPLAKPVAGGRPLPLHGRSSLTLLPPSLLEVEHAVRTILERVVVPAFWLSPEVDGGPAPNAAGHLDRIGYVFTNDSLGA
ncbi:MAG TPA: hypothetical protein VFW48_05155, partial [Solirubrobacterales bacterium]|nr:hypothetical protein [Solirubrobacterales bacterium]